MPLDKTLKIIKKKTFTWKLSYVCLKLILKRFVDFMLLGKPSLGEFAYATSYVKQPVGLINWYVCVSFVAHADVEAFEFKTLSFLPPNMSDLKDEHYIGNVLTESLSEENHESKC